MTATHGILHRLARRPMGEQVTFFYKTASLYNPCNRVETSVQLQGKTPSFIVAYMPWRELPIYCRIES